jgi:hypothetical protein
MPRKAPNPAAGGNRADLLVPTPPGIQPGGQPNGIPQQVQPIRTPTGLPYGENQQLTQDQQAAPLPQAPGAPSAPAGNPMDAAKNFQMPAGIGMMRPTDRPNEPVTAGLPGAPQTAGNSTRQVGSLSSMISAVAAAASSPALSQLAARAAAAGQ